MTRHEEELMRRARRWVARHGCPLPIDLAVEFMQTGLDVDAIETQLLSEK